MEKIFLDLTSIEKKSEVQNKAQEEFFNALKDFLTERYTDVRQVGNATLGVVIGQALDDDKFPHDVCIEVHGTVKHWYDSKRKFKGEVREIPAYDLDEIADEYAMDVEAKKKPKSTSK